MGFTITATELMAFLAAKGYHKETGRGRHGVKMVMGGMRISIPAHSRDLRVGTATSILAQAGYTTDDFIKWRIS
jgi:predicted RNA binding protein YcfA (HicA-like mRNA interferase family)